MSQLLLRGMIVGLVAGFVAFAFARVYGEPLVDRSIAVEESIAKARGEAPEPEIVSRAVQSSVGLLTGLLGTGVALGGLFAIAFAVCHARVSSMRAREFAALLALLGFTAVYLIPALKYPANPPAIGEPETIGIRTGLYFSMILVSLIAMVASFSLRRLLLPKLGSWNATLAGGAAFLVMIVVASLALPKVDEVPANFPAQVLWNFRLVSLGIQVILWGMLGLAFGALADAAERQTSVGPAAFSER